MVTKPGKSLEIQIRNELASELWRAQIPIQPLTGDLLRDQLRTRLTNDRFRILLRALDFSKSLCIQPGKRLVPIQPHVVGVQYGKYANWRLRTKTTMVLLNLTPGQAQALIDQLLEYN